MRLLELYNVIDEGVKSDTANLAVAQKAADAVHGYLKKHAKDEDTKNPYGMALQKRGDRPVLLGAMNVILKDMGWDTKAANQYSNLMLALFVEEEGMDVVEGGTVKGGYGDLGDTGMKILVLNMLLDRDPLAYVDSRFTGAKKTFIHEFTHHMDFVRSRGKAKGTKAGGTDVEYFSSPAEYNAYFTEVLDELDVWFHRILPRIMGQNPDVAKSFIRDMFGSGFQHFVKIAKARFLTPGFELTPKYEKKFARRLYGHYVALINALKERGLMEERILQAAFMDPATSVVYPVGYRHLIQPLMAHGVDEETMERIVQEPNQGFVTDKGRWIDRHTASELVHSDQEELDSRDIPKVKNIQFDINQPHKFKLAWKFLDMPEGDDDES